MQKNFIVQTAACLTFALIPAMCFTGCGQKKEKVDKDDIVISEEYLNAIPDGDKEIQITEETTPPTTEETVPEETYPEISIPFPDKNKDTVPKEEKEDLGVWQQMKVKINGVIYSYPYKYENFLAEGWALRPDYVMDDPADDLIDFGQWNEVQVPFYNEVYYKKAMDEYNTPQLVLNFKNDSDKMKSFKECKINGLELSRLKVTNSMGSNVDRMNYKVQMEIAGGIKIGSTKNDILKAMGGEPKIKQQEVGGKNPVYKWIYEDGDRGVYFYIYNDKVVEGIGFYVK